MNKYIPKLLPEPDTGCYFPFLFVSADSCSCCGYLNFESSSRHIENGLYFIDILIFLTM
jgi:hypothetical protein